MLHGGTYIGSAGCIDIGPSDELLYRIRLRKAIPLSVDYSEWEDPVPGNHTKKVKWSQEFENPR